MCVWKWRPFWRGTNRAVRDLLQAGNGAKSVGKHHATWPLARYIHDCAKEGNKIKLQYCTSKFVTLNGKMSHT